MRVELGGHCVAEIRVLLRLAEASGSWREPAKGDGFARAPAATSKSPTRGQVKIPHLRAADREVTERLQTRIATIRC